MLKNTTKSMGFVLLMNKWKWTFRSETRIYFSSQGWKK